MKYCKQHITHTTALHHIEGESMTFASHISRLRVVNMVYVCLLCFFSVTHILASTTSNIVSYLSACARTIQEHTTYSVAQALSQLDPEQLPDNIHQWFERYAKGPVGKQHGTYGAFVKFVALWKHSATFNYQDTASLSDQYIEGMLQLLAQADSDFFYSPFLADFATTILQTWKPSPSDENFGTTVSQKKAITQARKLARMYLEKMKDYLYTSPAYMHASYAQEAVHICKTDTLDKIKYSELGYVVGESKDVVWIKHITTGREVRIPLKTCDYALSYYADSLCDNGRYLMLSSRDNTFFVIYDLSTFAHIKVSLPQELDHRFRKEYLVHPSHPLVALVHRNQRVVTLYIYDIENQSWTHLNTLQNCDYCFARWLPGERLLLSDECLLDSTLNIQTASYTLHIYGAANYIVYTGTERAKFITYDPKSKIFLYTIDVYVKTEPPLHLKRELGLFYSYILYEHRTHKAFNLRAIHIPSCKHLLSVNSDGEIFDAFVINNGLNVIYSCANNYYVLHNLGHRYSNSCIPELTASNIIALFYIDKKTYAITFDNVEWNVYSVYGAQNQIVSTQKLGIVSNLYDIPHTPLDTIVGYSYNAIELFVYYFNKTSKTITKQQLSTFKPSSNSWIASMPKSPYIIFKKNENQGTILERNKSLLESLSDEE